MNSLPGVETSGFQSSLSGRNSLTTKLPAANWNMKIIPAPNLELLREDEGNGSTGEGPAFIEVTQQLSAKA